MSKSIIQSIESIDDVETFALQLKGEIGMGFHCDTLFEDYINFETGKDIYTSEQAKVRNVLIEQAFEVCQKCNVDIYGCMGRVIVAGTPQDGMFS